MYIYIFFLEFNPYMESLKVNDLLTVEIKNDK